MDYPTHAIFLPMNDEVSEDLQQPPLDQCKRKRKAVSANILKKGNCIIDSHQTLRRPLCKKRSRKKVKNKKLTQRFPPLGKNECHICKKKSPDKPSFTYHFLNHFNMTFLPKDGPHQCPACHKKFARSYNLYDHLFHICRFKDYDFSQKQQSFQPTQDSHLTQNSDPMLNIDATQNSELNASLINLSLTSSKMTKEESCLNSKRSSLSLQDQSEHVNYSKNETESTYNHSVTFNLSTSKIPKDELCYSLKHVTLSLQDQGKQIEHVNEFLSSHFKDGSFSLNQVHSQSTQDSCLTSNSPITEIPNDVDCFLYEHSSSLQESMEQSEHKANDDANSSQSSKKKIDKCPRCSKILPDMRSLTYHVLEHFDLSHLDGDPPYKCPGCEQTFLKKEFLYKHLVVTCHKGIKRSGTPFNCHLCYRAFQFEIQLEHHLLVHSGKANLRECNFCGKKFNTSSGFRYHLVSSHAEKKGHQCDQCPRYFKSLKVLEEHKMSHSGTYLFICKICGKNCDNSSCYQAHMRRHTENPERWQCDICGKDFSGKYCYKKHMRSHTGEVVAICNLCGKGFNQSGNLKSHYKNCQRHAWH